LTKGNKDKKGFFKTFLKEAMKGKNISPNKATFREAD